MLKYWIYIHLNVVLLKMKEFPPFYPTKRLKNTYITLYFESLHFCYIHLFVYFILQEPGMCLNVKYFSTKEEYKEIILE